MPDDHPKADRDWREIAEQVSKEHDSGKVAELSEELLKALEKEEKQPLEQMSKRKSA